MNETIAKALLVLAVAAGIFSAGGVAMYVHDQKAYTKLLAESASFHAGVETAFADYEAARKARETKDQSDREKADANQKRDLAAARADAKRLRGERDDARSRFLAEVPPGSKCPDGQVCFDRPLFDAAYRGLVVSIRASADSCTSVELALKSAMDWADGAP